MRRGKEGVGKGRDTQKCRFIEKRVREISHFFVATLHVFPLFVRARPRAHRFIHKYLKLRTLNVAYQSSSLSRGN